MRYCELMFLIVGAIPLCGQKAQAQMPERRAAETQGQQEALIRTLHDELRQQREAWQRLESAEHPLHWGGTDDPEPTRTRGAYAFCNGGHTRAEIERGFLPQVTRIPSRSTVLGVCPFWVPPRVRGPLGATHEYRRENPTPAQLAPFSEGLIAGLFTAARDQPREVLIISQLIRVLVENGEHVRARSALGECVVDETWCALLRLFAAHAADERAKADSLVRLLLRYSPIVTRRAWTDPAILLGPEDANAFLMLPDAERDSASRVIWWLARPFFGDEANLRLVAHLARLVRNSLAQQVEHDPFYHTGVTMGGDAVQVMRQRYGWADHQVWIGREPEERVAKRNREITPPPPYSAPEYSWPQSPTLPRLRAAVAPLASTDADYSLVPPAKVDWWRWWPFEFFRHPDGHILPFGTEQHVVLRRDSSARLLIATDLHGIRFGEVLESIPDLPVRGELWFSTGPDSMALLHAVTTRAGGRLALAGDLPKPGVVSAEYRVNAHGLAGGRSRFGVSALETLRELPAGTCALSTPMVLDPGALPSDGSTNAATIEAALLGSLTLADPSALGLAWESYGFTPGDTVTITVAVDRTSEISRLRRVGMVLGVAEDPSVSVAIQWTEPAAGRGHELIAASIPVLLRHLTLGVGTLKEGDYRLQVTMESAACGTVQQEQSVRITR